ncbi:hypothetical protein ACRS7P_24290 [Pseudomonas aeruginosa]|uniref:hypothetical protein n=2 Tax=Pseudomonas aeruginosa TaxID=287 RepID=UPI003AD2572A
MVRNLLGGLFLLAAFPATTMAFAADVDWQWNDPGSAGFYNGSQTLSNGASTSAFSRYAPGLTPNISADTVSQPPVLLIAGGSNIDFDVVQAGTAINKPTCSPPKVPAIYVTAVTVCDYGVGSNLGGFKAYADSTATQYIPRLAIWVQGQGWRNIDNHPCGMVKTETMCK